MHVHNETSHALSIKSIPFHKITSHYCARLQLLPCYTQHNHDQLHTYCKGQCLLHVHVQYMSFNGESRHNMHDY